MNFQKQLLSGFSLLAFALLICFSAASCSFAQTGKIAQTKVKQENPLVGRWQSDEATVEIRANGTLTINGEEYAYKVKNSVITVHNDEGTMQFPFELDGDTMAVQVEDREVIYNRVKGKQTGTSTGDKQRTGGVSPELVGKWCYLANLTGSNSRMSSRCFILNANGTYEYSAETSSSGGAGSSASQEYDSGRWSASATTITAHSNKHGTIVYSLEKRNHPKTGDPMLIVDGDAYVTAYQKSPW